MLGLLYTILICIINGSIQPTVIKYVRIDMHMVCTLLFLLCVVVNQFYPYQPGSSSDNMAKQSAWITHTLLIKLQENNTPKQYAYFMEKILHRCHGNGSNTK